MAEQYMHCVCVSILPGLPGLVNGCVLRRGGRAPLPFSVFSAGRLRALRHAVRRVQSVDANGQQVSTEQHLPIPFTVLPTMHSCKVFYTSALSPGTKSMTT